MPISKDTKLVARRIRASAQPTVFVHPVENKSKLSQITAAALSSNKAAYECGHCHTSIVASVGAEPHCTVCGTETKAVKASVSIKDVNPSELTAVECSSCGSVTLLNTETVTASNYHVHCSVCGHAHDYRKSAAVQASKQSPVTAAKKLEFLGADGETWGAYKDAGAFQLGKARMLAMEGEGLAMMPEGTGGNSFHVVKAPKKGLKYLNLKGEEVSSPEFIHVSKARQIAENHGDNVILIPETPSSFAAAILPAGVTAATAVTAAKKLQFLQEDGDTWGDYSGSGSFKMKEARMLSMEGEGRAMIPTGTGGKEFNIIQMPKGKMTYVDESGEPTGGEGKSIHVTKQ